MNKFFFSSRRRHTRFKCDWSSDVCSSDLGIAGNKLDIGWKIIFLFPKAFSAGSRGDNAHSNGNSDGGQKDEREAGNVGSHSKGNGGGQGMSMTIGCMGLQRVSASGNPKDAESTACGIKTRVIRELNSRGIVELKNNLLARSVAADRARDAVERLWGECEIDFGFLTRSDGDGSSRGKFGSNRVVDQRNTLRAGLRPLRAQNQRIPAVAGT